MPAFRIIFPPRPCLSLFVPSFSSFLLSCLYLFVSLLYPFCFFACCYEYLLPDIVFFLRLIFFFRHYCRLVFFCSLASLGAECVCLFFCFCLCSTPLAKRASLQSICKKLPFSCVSFCIYCSLLSPCLTLFFFSLFFPLGCMIFINIFTDFQRIVVIFILSILFCVVCGLLGKCGDLYSVPHVSDTYARGPPFSMFCLSEV